MVWVWAPVCPAIPVLPADDQGREGWSGKGPAAADSAVERPTNVPTAQVQYTSRVNQGICEQHFSLLCTLLTERYISVWPHNEVNKFNSYRKKKTIIGIFPLFCELSDFMEHIAWVSKQQGTVEVRGGGFLSEKLQVCSLWPAALYQAAQCGCYFVFQHSVQFFKLKIAFVLFCRCIFDERECVCSLANTLHFLSLHK